MADRITLHHPKAGTLECDESAVRVHERNGWSRKAPAAAKPAKAAPATAAAPTNPPATQADHKES